MNIVTLAIWLLASQTIPSCILLLCSTAFKQVLDRAQWAFCNAWRCTSPSQNPSWAWPHWFRACTLGFPDGWLQRTSLNSEETTQLRRMATWEKGPTTEPRTRDLRPNAEFQPREPRSRSRSLVPHRHKWRCGTRERDRLRGSRG